MVHDRQQANSFMPRHGVEPFLVGGSKADQRRNLSAVANTGSAHQYGQRRYEMSDVAYKLRGLAIGMASPSLGRDTVSQATDHIERLEADNARLRRGELDAAYWQAENDRLRADNARLRALLRRISEYSDDNFISRIADEAEVVK